MKKIVFILGLILSFCANARAELYHGIDIDDVYESSDWSSKEKIKEIIDDYTLLLQYRDELTRCIEDTEQSACMNKLAEDVIRYFYGGNTEDNLNKYNNYVVSTSNAYGIIYCLNKYRLPAGSTCNQENNANTQQFIEQYVNQMLQSIEKILTQYSFFENYKKN